MIKLVAFLKRKPGTSPEAFQDYWRAEHGPKVRAVQGIRGYVQSHTLLSGYRKGEPAYDGVAELWYDDTGTMRAASESAEWAAVRRDEPSFMDVDALAWVLTEEHVIADGDPPPDGVKNVELVIRRPDLPLDEFFDYWRRLHGPIATGIPTMRRYVQSHAIRSSYAQGRKPPCDGIASVWFENTDAMREGARSAAYAHTRADEANFLAPPLPFVITREHVVVPPPR
ncbi:MAG: hypothetical protein QOD06_2550 [Candidatus Binatota bacterium]|nr:hypothetical protein [Candidatus Binatota bacterium]